MRRLNSRGSHRRPKGLRAGAVGRRRVFAVVENPVIVLIGASIIEGAFGRSLVTPHAAATQAFADAGVVNPTVYGYGFGGETTSGAVTRLSEAMTAFPNAYYIVHTGGNDITPNRPYSSMSAGTTSAIEADWDALITQAQTKPGKVFIANATFRDYGDACFQDPSLGSKPYNDNIFVPRISAGLPHAMNGPIPLVDFYRWSLADFETYLTADNIHHTAAGQAAMRAFTAARTAHVFTGGAAPGNLTERVYEAPPVVTFDVGDVLTMNYNLVSTPPINSHNANNVHPAIALLKDDGSDPGVTMTFSTAAIRENTGANGYGLNEVGRPVAQGPYDGTLYNNVVLGNSMFFGASATGTIDHSGLPQGTYEIAAVGSRDTVEQRTTRITLEGGATGTYNTSVDPPAAPLVLTGTADVDGTLSFTISNAGGSYSYLGGYSIKRIS